ncbi:MAG TPA: tRNA (adenosine(37)-N6)-threonylcarbamoyltransferase complex dimerization subunit type 1 TsaB [Waddliaceae bacterium]
MLALVIETATERAVVALVQDNNYLYMAGLPVGFHNSKYLVPKIEEAFFEARKTPNDLNAIAVGAGPGSYTGVRVGVAVAKTLSYASKIPMVGVGTLESFIPNNECSFCAILDAKLSGFYVLKGKRFLNKVTFQGTPEICGEASLKQFLEGIDVLVTPVVSTLNQKVERVCPGNKWVWYETAPDALEMARSANEKLKQGQYSLDGSLEIIYLK